jgi:hypothetical protein
VKHKQALKAIHENCAACWVEEGVSIRNLTLAESIAARNEQAKRREPLEYAEIHGLRYDPPSSGVVATRDERRLIWEAHDFLRSVAA